MKKEAENKLIALLIAIVQTEGMYGITTVNLLQDFIDSMEDN